MRGTLHFCRRLSTSLPKIALTCPGQGLIRNGPLMPYMEHYSLFKHELQQIDETLGVEFSSYLTTDSQNDQFWYQTSNSQPGILATTYIIHKLVKELKGIDLIAESNCVLGHSLGEFSALALNNVFDLASCIRLVRKRGLLMEEAVKRHSPNKYAMFAVLCRPNQTDDIIKFARETHILANINSGHQIVISGESSILTDWISRLSPFLGVKRPLKTVQLSVNIPFHNAILGEIEPILADYMKSMAPIPTDHIAMVNNLDATASSDVDSMLTKMVSVTSRPVNWLDSVKYLEARGITKIVNLGPGTVLNGLNTKISAIPNVNIDTLDAIKTFEL